MALTAALVLTLIAAVAPVGAGAAEWHVVGGGPANEGDWPATVALVRADANEAVSGQFCAGTAISATMVLTAAHCFHTVDGTLSRLPSQVRVVAGHPDLTAAVLDEHPLGTDLFVHPDFDVRGHIADVAVLAVDRDLPVPPQRLADPSDPSPAAGSVAVILGWGRTGPESDQASSTTTVLHEAHVPVVSPERCAEAFDPSPDPVAHVCAGGDGTTDQPGADACRGDSGGPLLLPVEQGGAVQIGITAFGPPVCGVDAPGVYTAIGAHRAFIDTVLAGGATPVGEVVAPQGAEVLRVMAGQAGPIAQAIASSRAVFADGTAAIAVLARPDAFPDGLAGSALLYGRGPLLFTPPDGPLDPDTAAELDRALVEGATVYLLGGPAAIPESVSDEVADRGFVPVRLAGATREGTAVAVAQEALARQGKGNRPPFGTVILATSQAWPDAVLAGQLAVWWGYPVLLTQPETLPDSVADALSGMAVERLLVVGGPAAVADTVVDAAVRLTGATPRRLSGASRAETGVQIARFHREELAAWGQSPPDTAVAVNIRREGGFADVLSAVPILGATAGVFVPVEGDAGDVLPRLVELRVCGLAAQPLAIGGEDVIADNVLTAMALSLAQSAC